MIGFDEWIRMENGECFDFKIGKNYCGLEEKSWI